MFANFQKLQQFANVSEPKTPISSVHARVKEIVNGWLVAVEDPEQLLSTILELREQVGAFLKQADEPVDTPEAQFVFQTIRSGIGLHYRACELLLEAFEEEPAGIFSQIFTALTEGDRLLAEAELAAARYRSESGITG